MTKRKIDLQQNRLSPVSRKYLWRFVVYLFVLIVLSLLIYALRQKDSRSEDLGNIEQIEGVTLQE